MTISESIITWMQGYSGGVTIADEISVDQLMAMGEGCGIFKSPGDQVLQFIGGSRDITANFLFLICQPSQTNRMRMDNQEWLEGFETWVRDQNRARDLPDLGAGRQCISVSVANSYAIQRQTDAETIYHITVSINYFEEG